MLQFSAWRILSLATACADMSYSSVPLGSEVIPESLLKKRKSQEKAREVRAAETQKKRAVSQHSTNPLGAADVR